MRVYSAGIGHIVCATCVLSTAKIFSASKLIEVVFMITTTVTSPPATGTTVAPKGSLNVIASASSTSGIITGWQIYLGSSCLYNLGQTDDSGPIAQSINVNLPIDEAPGEYTLTVKAYDATGKNGPVTCPITVAAGAIMQNVILPMPGESFTAEGTLQVTADAMRTATAITAWDIWLDNVQVYETNGNNIPNIDAVIQAPADTADGEHSLTIKCWDETGTVQTTVLPVNIPSQSNSEFSPGLPSKTKPVSSFTVHNPSSSPTYDAAHYPSLFTGTTNCDGADYPVDPKLYDDSVNASATLVISKESVRNLMPLNPDGSSAFSGRIGMHLQAWWGLSSHPENGLNDMDSGDVQRQVQDIKDRGYDLLVPDWYSPTKATVCNDAIVDLFANACTMVGLNFAIMIDQQFFKNNNCTPDTYESDLIEAINHLMDRYASHSQYEKCSVIGGVARPLLLLWNVASVAGSNVNWSHVRDGVASHSNPLLIQYQASGFNVAESDGSLSWLDDNADNEGNPSGSNYLTNSFFPACSSHQDQICISSVWHGFNGTLTRNPAWSFGKYIDQCAGQTWLDVWAVNAEYVSGGKRLDYVLCVTGDDFEEGSGVLNGTRTDVTVSLSMEGNTLVFSTTGNENTVRRYNLWGSTDGITATLLGTQLRGNTKQFDLDDLPGLKADGTYMLYLEAQGMPSLQSHISLDNPVQSLRVKKQHRKRHREKVRT